MNLDKLLCVWAVLVLIVSINFAGATEPDELVLDLDEAPKVKQGNPKIESILVQLHSARALGNMSSFAKQRGITIHSEIVWEGQGYTVWYESVRVILDFEDYSEENIEDLGRRGVKVETSASSIVQALVPVFQLQSVSKLPFVKYVRVPLKPSVYMVSEGVSVISATELHGLGIYGAGVKVAILDLGFEGYEAKLGVELPSSVTTRSFRADGDITGGGEVHGTACAEVVCDVAPGAQLYLVNFDTGVEFLNAMDWLIAQGVDVISLSIGWVNAGPYDGTGFICDAVNNARSNGILVSVSAGNAAQRHYQGTYQSTDEDQFHDFAPGDEVIQITAYSGQQVLVFLSWSASWPTNEDYDLYLYHLLPEGLQLVALSITDQAGSASAPVEGLSYIVPSSGTYLIAVIEYSTSTDWDIELFSFTHTFETHNVPEGSLLIPADAAGSFTVGATYWGDDSLEPFSSRGPTNDGRIKPDVTAPDGVTTSAYYPFPFFGTSASAPHTAGATALLLSNNPTLTVAQIESDLESGAIDYGDSGKDNLFGAGRIDVYESLLEYIVTIPVDFGTVNGGGTYIQTGVITASKYANTITVSSVVQTSGTLDALEEIRYMDGTPTTGEADLPVLLFQEGLSQNVNLIDTWEPIVMLPYSKLNMEAYAGMAPGTWGAIVITFTVT